MTHEQWRMVPGYEGLYQVSSRGTVVSMDRIVMRGKRRMHIKARVMKPGRQVTTGGHMFVALSKGGKRPKYMRVHRLVLAAFTGDQPDMDCCHNNGDPTDNRLENLRWDTRKGNMADCVAHGTSNRGERNGMRVLTEAQVREIKMRRAAGEDTDVTAADMGVRVNTVRDIVYGRRWKHVTI